MNATRLDAQGVTVPVAELVEVEPLAEAVGVAVAFGAGLMFVFSLAALASSRAYEARMQRRFAAARAWSAVAAVGVAGVLAAIAFGLIVMATK